MMKTNFKKVLCSLLVVVMFLTAAPLQGFVGFDWSWLDFGMRASALAETGQCGDNVSYSYNSSTKKLVITGEGPMTDYKNYGESPFFNSDIKIVVIENGVTTIGEDVFRKCKSINSVTIPNSVKTINSRAFYECNSLTTITIPSSVTYIGDSAFSDCKKLKYLTISEGVSHIGEKAFGWCESLNEVTIPTSLKTCGVSSIFFYCTNLKKVIFAEGTTSIPAYIFNCAYINATIIIPESVTSIGDCAFSYETLTNISLPKNLTSIGKKAFWGCKNLKNIVIPESVTSIGESAFGCCYNLANITIPDGVTEIKSGTFWVCENLKNIIIPKSVKSIGSNAFGGCKKLSDVYYKGTEQEWNSIDIDYVTSGESYYADRNAYLKSAKKHYNYIPPQDSYFMVSSDQYSVDSIHRNETATYKVHLLDENSDFLPVDEVIVQNNTSDIVNITTNKVSDTEIELTVEPIKDGDASISLFNGDGSVAQFFNFVVYSNTTTYRADQVPVTNEKLKTNFSRGDMTVDNFEYYFDENKGKYIATMDVYNRSGAIGIVAAYTQGGLISDIEQVDPYKPLPSDFGEFLVYLGTGAVSIAKGENWNYRYSGYCQKTSIEIEVPEDGYITVSCDILADEIAMIYSFVSLSVETAFKTAEIIDYLGTDTDKLAKEASKTIVRKTSEYFKSKKGKDWLGSALSKLSKKMSKQFSIAYLEDMSLLSFEMVEELCANIGTDFSELFFEVIDELIQEEIKSFGIMSVSKKLIKDKVIGVAERNFLKVASAIFDGGAYINLANKLVGTYLYNQGTGKTMIVFKPNGEDGFLCKDTIKVTSDIITDEVLLNTYIIKDTQKADAFISGRIHPYFNRDDGLDDREISIDLNRDVEIHEISLLKNGEVVTDGFTAIVEMNLPSYIDRKTCSVYRVEKDGTYTKLDTRIEDGKIIFETDHFSEYILTGIRNDVAENTPCDGHIYEEVRTEPTCTETGSIAYTCYCGETYSEIIAALGHTEEVVNEKAATATSNGYTGDVVCSVCGELIEEGEIIPATGTQSKNCDHMCHKSGFVGFIWKIVQFFWNLFNMNPVCECGAAHY